MLTGSDTPGFTIKSAGTQTRKFEATLPKAKQATKGTASEIQIAEAVLFARKLSDHWPILADVHLI